jgi:CDP-glucose 4,6-dehydratase
MCDCRPVADLVADFSARLGPLAIEVDSAELKTKHETQILLLDSSETEQKLRWKPRWSIDESLEATASWYRTAYSHPTNLQSLSDRQLKTYFHELTPDAAHTGTHTSPLMK